MRLQKTITVLFALLLSAGAYAQNVDVTKPSIKKIGDNVTISFDAMVDKLPFNYKLTLTPILWNGEKEQSLRPIVIMGRIKSLTQSRKGGIQSGSLISKFNKTIPYSVTIPFERWMGGVSLRIDKMLNGCCESEMLSPLAVTNNGARNFLKPILSPITPLFGSDVTAYHLGEFKAKVKSYPFVCHIGGAPKHIDYKTLSVCFAPSSITVAELSGDNKKTLQQIKDAIELIKSESNIELTKITIEGGASPEGTYKLNKKLGEGRASSIIALLSQYVEPHIFDIDNLGENWNGLYSMVERSDMKYRDEVLSIIDNYDLSQGRERKLRDLGWGHPYRYMLDELFPALRTASYIQVFYDLKPNAESEKIDKASEFITSKSYNESLVLLKEVSSTPYTDNLMGVCYMMLEDEANARIYLQKAIDGGSSDAQNNLTQLDYQRDNIQYK